MLLYFHLRLVFHLLLDVDEDLVDVKEAILPIVFRWYEVGERLRLKTGDLEGIQCEHLSPEKSLTEVLKLWLRKVCTIYLLIGASTMPLQYCLEGRKWEANKVQVSESDYISMQDHQFKLGFCPYANLQ